MGKHNQSLPLGTMCEKETVLKAAFRYGPGDCATAINVLEAGSISVKSMVSSIVPFDQATEVWERTMRGKGIKNLIQGLED